MGSKLKATRLVMFAAVALLGGCGDSDSDEGAQPTQSSPTTSSPSTASEGGADTPDTTDGSPVSQDEGSGGGSSELSCDSIPPPAVEALLGSAPAPTEESLMGVTSCEFVLDADNAVSVSTGDSAAFRQSFETIESASQGAVPGVGEKAYLAEGFSSASMGGTKGLTIWVDTGDGIWSIAAKTSNGEVDSVALESLTRELLD